MTHDLLTAFDIGKIYSEIVQDCKTRFEGQGRFSCVQMKLQNKALLNFNEEKVRNEYSFLIGTVYEHACGRENDQEPYIGNVMRQVLEAFSTFEYKKRIDIISTDEDILSLIESEADREYFKSLMYRLVLNEGSHRYDQTRAMQMDYFAMISGTEKRRTAKEVLCFMKLLNAPHIKAHLGVAALDDIEIWCEEIRTRTGVSS